MSAPHPIACSPNTSRLSWICTPENRALAIGPATLPLNTFASTPATAPELFRRRIPLPPGKLFAQGDFLEFPDAGPRNGLDEHKRIRQLPLRENCSEKNAQLCSGGALSVFQYHGCQRALLPLRMWNSHHTRFFHRRMSHERIF